MDNNQLFRKKAMDHISSPDTLNKYIKAAPAGVWLILAAAIVFLAGVCCWGFFGSINTTVKSIVCIQNGNAYAYVRSENITGLEDGMTVVTDEEDFTISSIEDEPFLLSQDAIENGYVAYHLDKNSSSLWVYEMKLDDNGDLQLKDGYYTATIVVESVRPFHYVFN